MGEGVALWNHESTRVWSWSMLRTCSLVSIVYLSGVVECGSVGV